MFSANASDKKASEEGELPSDLLGTNRFVKKKKTEPEEDDKESKPTTNMFLAPNDASKAAPTAGSGSLFGGAAAKTGTTTGPVNSLFGGGSANASDQKPPTSNLFGGMATKPA